TGRSTEAVDLLRALPEVTGDLRRETLLIAALSAAKGPAEARREVERLVARSPKDANILSLAAAYAESQGDHAGARGYLQRGRALAPGDARLLTLLAQVEMNAGSLDAAEDALRRLLEVPAARTTARLGLVDVARLRGNKEEARKGLEQIRTEDAKAIAPRLMLARLMLGDSQAAPAARVLAEALAIAPQDAQLKLQVARLLAEFGRYDEAMRQAREASTIA